MDMEQVDKLTIPIVIQARESAYFKVEQVRYTSPCQPCAVAVAQCLSPRASTR